MKADKTDSLDIPTSFLERMSGLLKDEYPAFEASLLHPTILGVRINTLKISASEYNQITPWQLSPVPWCSNGFTVDSESLNIISTTPGKHPYHLAGLYYLQEPSTMAAAETLAPRPGERVLDIAAAPGGKATHLAALMQNTGLLVTNEIHSTRVWDLAENLERCGVTNAVVTNETPQKLADHFGDFFDKVLVDAPCSGEGMFRKGQVARQEWKPELVRSCAIRQSSILEQAARLVKPGGCLVYTTCTFSPEENEEVIAKFLGKHPNFELAAVPPKRGISPARPDWINLPDVHDLKRAMRIWPHNAPGEGLFLASLVKSRAQENAADQIELKQRTHTRLKPKNLPEKSALSALDAFIQGTLAYSLDSSCLRYIGSYLYILPKEVPDLSGLHVIHPGWWLGSVHKERFIPSHAFAMALKSDQVRQKLSMLPADPRLRAFFSGESIQDAGVDGWVLMCVDDYPVGWAKRVKNTLKNYYPRGLRRYL